MLLSHTTNSNNNMKSCLLFILGLFTFSLVSAQSPIGKWDTYDDEDGKRKSTVEIYEENGKLYGKIVHIYDETKRNNTCTKCSGDKKDKPLMGLVIMENMVQDGDEWEDGEIIKPSNGKTYDCKIWLEGNDVLQVRGYVGFLFKTQTWKRVK